MSRAKPYAPACDRNRDPILAVLLKIFRQSRHVLEIGSGTGQHAVYFAKAMPWLIWQTSDLPIHHAGISAWVDEAGLDNVRSPLELDVDQKKWPIDRADGVFSANTVHIIAWESVCNLFEGIGKILEPGGFFSLYGPFNYNGRYTSKSNSDFDIWLKQRDLRSGIRDFEAVCELAIGTGLKLVNDFEMPANNRLLIWKMVTVQFRKN